MTKQSHSVALQGTVEPKRDFSVEIINLVKYLKSNHETILANQIGRSGTSIGANIYEAQYAQGKKDFISKLKIALKEAKGIQKQYKHYKKAEKKESNPMMKAGFPSSLLWELRWAQSLSRLAGELRSSGL